MIAGAFLALCVPRVAAQSQDDFWGTPVNLSQSGAASQPRIVASSDGRLQAFWWDQFDGLVTAVFDGENWSEPRLAPIFSQNLQETPLIIADASGWVYALWTEPAADEGGRLDETNQSLVYTLMEFGGNHWFSPKVIAESVLIFDAATSPTDGVFLAYIRTRHTAEFPAGIYLKRNLGNGKPWEQPTSVYNSIYTRLITADQTYINIDIAGRVLSISWFDARSNQDRFFTSQDQGQSWSSPDISTTQENLVSHFRQVALPHNQGLLRLGEISRSEICTLYQQFVSFGEADITLDWNSAETALEGLSACPRDDAFLTGQENIYWIWGQGSSQLSISAWLQESASWSSPVDLEVDFIDDLTQQQVRLDNLHSSFDGDQLAVIGTDPASGEIWTTIAPLSAIDFANPDLSGWAQPAVVSSSEGQIQSVFSVPDPEGQIHAFWIEQSASSSLDAQSPIFYSRWDTHDWTSPISILRDINPAQLVAGRHPDGRLLLAWRGGRPSQIYFSWANSSSASSHNEWETPVAVSNLHLGATSPSMDIDPAGKISIAYALPINQGRGIYLTQSDSLGQEWTEPVLVFDGAAAGWEIVDRPLLVRSSDGSLHILWSRYSLPIEAPKAIGFYYSRSMDGGQTWSEPEALSENSVAWAQMVSAGEQGLHRIWIEANQSLGVLMHQISYDGGLTWIGSLSYPMLGFNPDLIDLKTDRTGQLHLTWISSDLEGEQLLHHRAWNEVQLVESESQDLNWGGEEVVLQLKLAVSPDDSLRALYISQLRSLETGPVIYTISSISKPLHLPEEPESGGLVEKPLPTPVSSTTAVAPTQQPAPTPTPTVSLASSPAQGGSSSNDLIIKSIIYASGLITVLLAVIFGRSRFTTRGK